MDGSPSNASPAWDATLAEFSALRTEVIARLGHAHQILFFNLAALAALITLHYQARTTPLILLLVPLMSVLLAFYWVENYRAILGIGEHIRGEEWPFLRGLLPQGQAEVLPDWEQTWHRRARPRLAGAVLNVAPLALFVAPAILTLSLSAVEMDKTARNWGLWSSDLLVVLVAIAVAPAIYREMAPLIHHQTSKASDSIQP